MCNTITEVSGGRLELEVFAGGAIAPFGQEVFSVGEGVIEMTAGGMGGLVERFGPVCTLFQVKVGGMNPIGQDLWMVKGGGHELITEMLADYNVLHLKGVGLITTPEVFAHTNKRLDSLKDIEGMKMRAAGDAGIIMKEFGVATLYLPFGEIFEAMQRGTIDAFEAASPAVDWDLGLQEIADYVYISALRAPTNNSLGFVNKDAWEALPPDLQKLVLEVGKAAALDHYYHLVAADMEGLKNFEAYGCEVLAVPKDINDALKREADKFYTKEAEDPFYKKVLDSYMAFQEAYDGYVGRW